MTRLPQELAMEREQVMEDAITCSGPNEQREIDRILGRVSDRLADISNAHVLAGIEDAVKSAVAGLGVDRCTFSELIAGDYLNILCSSATSGFEPLPRGYLQLRMPWFFAQLRAGKTVAVSNLPVDLPTEAVEETQYCRDSGLQAHLSIPVRVGGRVTCVLSFAMVNRRRQWSSETIARLKLLGDMLGCLLALARVKEEARELRSRMWHADRVERITALTAAIAHELNQPLAAILSNAQAGLKYLANDEVDHQALVEILQAVVREDKRAAGTIRAMRDLIRKDESRHEAFDLVASLGEVKGLLSGELVSQGVRIDFQGERPCWVVANRIQVEQLCLNLLLNAAAAVQSQPLSKRVIRLEVSSGSGGQVLMAVHDTGQGIATQDLQTVFEPFWTTREDGLGLGLAICRSIVEAHGGRIWAESNNNGGATFQVRLPEACSGAAAPGTAAQEELLLAAAQVRDVKKRQGAIVCIVDDDAEVRTGLLRLLWQAGWVAHAYASADEFLSSPADAEVACLLLDLHMPGSSGRQLQERLAQHDRSPGVIFMTGNGDLAVGVEAMKAGAEDFLEKPIDADVLLAAVARAVERHQTKRRQSLLHDQWRERMMRLSVREREVMAEVVKGRLNKQIAADLFIAEQTVKQHRGRVMEKMGVRSVAELVRACEITGFSHDSLPRLVDAKEGV